MAEYIEREEFLKRIKPYDTEDKTDKALYNFALNQMMGTPNADVVEREKINKAIKEMEIEYNNLEYTENHNKGASYGIRKSMEILKRNIGENDRENE